MSVLVLCRSYNTLRKQRIKTLLKCAHESACIVSEVKNYRLCAVCGEMFKSVNELLRRILLELRYLHVAHKAVKHFSRNGRDLYRLTRKRVICVNSVTANRENDLRTLCSAHCLDRIVKSCLKHVNSVNKGDNIALLKPRIVQGRILQNAVNSYITALVLTEGKSQTNELSCLLAHLVDVLLLSEIARVLVVKSINIALEDTVAEVSLVYFAKVIIADKRVERFKRIIPSRFVIHVNDLLVETLEREKRSQYESYRDCYRNKAQRKTKADFFIHIIISSLETARIGEMRTDS